MIATDPDIENEHTIIHNTISRNIVVSVLTNILYLLTRLFIPPFILHYVTLGEYGIWSYCFILISYLGMSVFGVTNVYIRYVAIYAAKGDTKSISRLISTGIIAVLLLCIVLIPLLWFGLPLLFKPLHLSSDLYSLAFYLIFGTMIIFMIDLTVGAFGYVLQSLQKIVAERMIWTFSYLIETACIVIFLLLGSGVYGLLYAFFIRTVTAIILYTIVCFRALPGLSLRLRNFDRKMLSLFFHFGGIVQLSGLLGILNRSLEKIIAGFFISVEATGLYEVGEKFPVMALMLPGSINMVFLPTTAHLHAREMHSKIVDIYVKGGRLINMLTGMMMGFMAPFAAPIIIAWIGIDPKYQDAASILAWFTIAYQMDVLTGPASAIYRSINQPRKELIYGYLQLSMVVVAVAVGFFCCGYTIAVINITVASMKVLSALIYLLYSNQNLDVSHRKYFFEVIVPGLIPYAFGYSLMWLSLPLFASAANNRYETFFYLLLACIAYTVAASLFLFFVICTKKEKNSFRRQISYTIRELFRMSKK